MGATIIRKDIHHLEQEKAGKASLIRKTWIVKEEMRGKCKLDDIKFCGHTV